MFIAFLLLLFGVVMPFLMVIHVVASTFFWNFLSYGASILGLLLGIISIVASQPGRKKKQDQDDFHR
ncbi:MAG: hypothetical protein HFACDABA_02360 [Anaerolineales bacterium]|nr:hypothetical protein [Anaerolineales bacterium]